MLENSEILLEINDNILILQEKIEYLNGIQFNFLVLSMTIVILAIIYLTVMKFIK